MDVQELLAQAKDAITVGRVFGEPLEQGGVVVIPVAAVRGGGGGGSGDGQDGEGSGSGSGFGLTARPVGVYVVKNGQVSWEPAFDLNHVILGGQIVAVALLLMLRVVFKHRGKTKRARLRSSS
ncbi:MAG: spore germination protein GerW family protein [Actinomycetota bacterium]